MLTVIFLVQDNKKWWIRFWSESLIDDVEEVDMKYWIELVWMILMIYVLYYLSFHLVAILILLAQQPSMQWLWVSPASSPHILPVSVKCPLIFLIDHLQLLKFFCRKMSKVTIICFRQVRIPQCIFIISLNTPVNKLVDILIRKVRDGYFSSCNVF